MPFTAENKRRLRNFQVEWVEPGEFLISRSNVLFRGTNARGPFDRLIAFPTTWYFALAGKFQIGRRFLRHHFYNVFKIDPEHYFVTFGKSLGIWKKGAFKFISGGARKFRVLRSGFAFDKKGCLFFGEYFANWNREEVHIYRASLADAHMEIVYTFPAKSLRHIHAVITDPYDDALWLLGGDIKEECCIGRTYDQFKTLEFIGRGNESWRATTLEFSKDHVYYATDGEHEQNRIYRMDRKTCRREVLAEIEGSVLSSGHSGNNLFFAVSGEKCPVNPRGNVVLWHVNTVAGHASRILSNHKKDLWHQAYFQLGQYLFPSRYALGLENEVYFTAKGLAGIDGHTFCLNQNGVNKDHVETIS